AVVGLLLLVWLVSALLAGGNDPEEGALIQSPSETPVSNVGEVVSEGSEETPQVVDDQAAAIGNAAALAGSENLPLSRNARADLGIGMRVQIVPGLQLALR